MTQHNFQVFADDKKPQRVPPYRDQVAREFMPDDHISYIGDHHRAELGGKTGTIHAPVIGQPNTYIVYFHDTKDQDSYVLHGSLLKPYVAKEQGPVVESKKGGKKKSKIKSEDGTDDES
jgi:hypothetical protein